METPSYPRVQFRLGDLQPALAARSEGAADARAYSQQARSDLQRYYALLAEELRRVDLTLAEASLLADATNGTLWEPVSIRQLAGEIADAIRLDRLDQKWAVDGPALLARLDALTPGQRYAIVDACARFWLDPNPLPEKLRAVGLVR